jgi:hypothetical protein
MTRRIVSKLNTALRETKYKEALWRESTGKTLDELWKEFADSQAR